MKICLRLYTNMWKISNNILIHKFSLIDQEQVNPTTFLSAGYLISNNFTST